MAKFIYSTMGYFIVTMSVAYPWHVMLFHEEYVALGALTRDEPVMLLGMIAVILQGLVFSYFYPLFYKYKGGGHPVWRGIQFSLFMGLTVYTVMVFATAAKFNIEPVHQFIVLGTLFQILQFVLVGVAIGLIYGKEIA